MEKYSLYCTPGQTKRALELGAPIEYAIEGSRVVKGRSFYYSGEITIIPTVEQMICWLEESDLIIEKEPASVDDKHNCLIVKWRYYIREVNSFDIIMESNKLFDSNKEATLAAIDAALEYLIHLKNDE